MSLLFGRLTQDFVSFGSVLNNVTLSGPVGDQARADFPKAAAAFRHSAALDASYLVYIGVGMLFATFAYMYIWVYTGEINAKRLRERYLKAVLRQDVAYFDNVGAGEVATRIQTDTRESISSNTVDCHSIVCYRPGPTRYFRKGRPRCQLLGSVRHWFRPRVQQVVASRSGTVLHFAMYRYHRWRHEQIHLNLYAVSVAHLFCSLYLAHYL